MTSAFNGVCDSRVIADFNTLSDANRRHVWRYINAAHVGRKEAINNLDTMVYRYVRENYVTPAIGRGDVCCYVSNDRASCLAWMLLQGFNIEGLS